MLDKLINERLDNIDGMIEHGIWTTTGNQITFERERHMIYEIAQFDYYYGEIKIPEGYAYVSSEPIIGNQYSYGGKLMGIKISGIKYNYINIIPVEVLEYQNTETGEFSYPFAGTPLDLEKAQTASKVYSKTM